MEDIETIKTTKCLRLVLRHEPERVGLRLGDAGWVAVEGLLQAVNRHGLALTLDQFDGVWLVDPVPPQFIEFPNH